MIRFIKVLFTLIFSYQICSAQSQQGGFTDQWNNFPAGTFGPKTFSFDTSSLRSISIVPASGIHPRIYFGPADLPEIQDRLQNTQAGQEVFKQLHAYTTLMHLSYNPGLYNHNSSYGADAFGNRRISNAGKWNKSALYSGLVSGDLTILNGVSNKDRYLLSSVMALEAFECLVMAGQFDNDTGMNYDDRAEMLGKAMSTWAQIVYGDPLLNWNNYHHFGGVHMAFAYDLNYNSMTGNQRDSVRLALAETIPATPRYGVNTENYATTSNWVGLNSFELLTNFALEGESGYNASLTKDYMNSYYKFISYGWYASGTPFEGLGKNYQFVTSLIAAAKRGYSLLPHPHVRSFGESFLPAITQPYGHAFFGTDVWGGSGWNDTEGGYKFNAADVLGLKYAFPDNEAIDFVWRNYIEEWYQLNSSGYVYQQIEPATSGYHNYLLMAAIFADDYTSGNWSLQNENTLGSKSYFAPERGMAIMRSGFEEDNLMMQFHCRQDFGGHTNGDRNSFTLSGLERIWVRYTYGSNFQPTEYHSCILVNDTGIAITPNDGQKARQPGKVLSFNDGQKVITISGDATYAYTWEYHWSGQNPGNDHPWLGSDGWIAANETWNDFRYQQGNEFYHNIPFYDFGHWNNPGQLERIVKRQYNPMQRVYRTASMVHGEKPYVLIVDDVQKDSDVHNYKWLAQIANDLKVDTMITDYYGAEFRNDIILKESNGGSRKLLVRVLNNNGQCRGSLYESGLIVDGLYESADSIGSDGIILGGGDVEFEAGRKIELEDGFQVFQNAEFCAEISPCTETAGYLEIANPGINGNAPITRLVLEADVVAPDFKVLLFPFYDGDDLPVTRWNANRDQLSVEWGTGSETISFSVQNGLTEVLVD